MPRTNIPLSQPVHWSKDFVEHLRTVHLSLVAVSVAIIIIVLSASPYNPSAAVRELHQIVELKKVWSPEWIREHGSHEPVTFADILSYPNSGRTAVSLGPNSKALLALTNSRDSNKSGPFQLLLLPSANYIEGHPEAGRINAATFPTVLSNFEKWWSDLSSQPAEIYFPVRAVGRSGRLPSSSPFLSYPTLLDSLDSIESFPTVPSVKLYLVSTSLRDQHSAFYGVGFPATAKSPSFDFHFSITNADRVRVGRQNLAAFFGNWQTGGFEESFSDLSEAARDFDSLELEEYREDSRRGGCKGRGGLRSFRI